MHAHACITLPTHGVHALAAQAHRPVQREHVQREAGPVYNACTQILPHLTHNGHYFYLLSHGLRILIHWHVGTLALEKRGNL